MGVIRTSVDLFSSLIAMKTMNTLLLLTGVAGYSHEDITYSQWQTESSDKKIMLDMYAEW